MKRRYQEWVFATMTILGVSGDHAAFGQADDQSPSPISPKAAPSGRPEIKIPPPLPFRLRATWASNTPAQVAAPTAGQSGTAEAKDANVQRTSGYALAQDDGTRQPRPPAPSGDATVPYPGTIRKVPGEAMPEGVSPLGRPPGAAEAAPSERERAREEPGARERAGETGTGREPSEAAPESTTGNEAASAGLGGEAGAGSMASLAPAVIGDQSPYSFLQALKVPPIPTPYPPPRPGTSPFVRTAKSIAGIVPAVRGLKIADNQSPRPLDRVFSSFNYYDNVNRPLNERLGAPIQNMIVYRQVYGFEKTFFDQAASIGITVPINTLTIQSSRGLPALGGTSTAFGNMNVFTKFILWENQAGSLISAGIAIDTPTGPNSFAGFPTILGKNVTDIQPFLGYIFTNGGELFVQGFGSIAVPTDSNLPTLLFLDAALGYFLYRDNAQGSFLTAVVPTFETHLNIPLNHTPWNFNDTYGTPTVVDLTFGLNTVFCTRGILRLGYCLPVTGPPPFSGEFILQFNWLFGNVRRRTGTGTVPPFFGG
jgi:hypothetical protein